jgi:hypothetical protein
VDPALRFSLVGKSNQIEGTCGPLRRTTRGEGEGLMVWGFVRVALFTGAFSVGMLLSHSGLHGPSAPASVLNENAGASLVVACNDGSVIINELVRSHNAIQLKCVQSKMVVVRDHRALENIPVSNRTSVRFQR